MFRSGFEYNKSDFDYFKITPKHAISGQGPHGEKWLEMLYEMHFLQRSIIREEKIQKINCLFPPYRNESCSQTRKFCTRKENIFIFL